jgi:hypothetical protein
MQEFAFLRDLYERIDSVRSRIETDSGLFDDSDVKEIPNAIALYIPLDHLDDVRLLLHGLCKIGQEVVCIEDKAVCTCDLNRRDSWPVPSDRRSVDKGHLCDCSLTRPVTGFSIRAICAIRTTKTAFKI